MKNFKIARICFIAVILLAVSCGESKKPRPSSIQSIPNWFNDAGSPNDGFIYGIASHPALARAKEKALREIAAKIQVSIQSETESVTNKIGTGFSQTYQEVIRAKVADVSFNNPETVNQAKIGNTFYVRMRVSVDSLVRATVLDIEQIERDIAPIETIESSGKSRLEKLFAYKAYNDDLVNGISLCLRIRSLSNFDSWPVEYPIDEKLDYFSSKRAKVGEILREVSLDIQYSPDISDLASVIADAMNSEKLRASINPTANPDGALILESSFNESKIYNDFLVSGDLVFSLKDGSGEILSTGLVKLKSFSPKDHQHARRLLAGKLKKEILSKGILNLLKIN